MTEGWMFGIGSRGSNYYSRKYHYFNEGGSLCGLYTKHGGIIVTEENWDEIHFCKSCLAKKEKKR